MTALIDSPRPTTPPCTCGARTATHSPRERWRYIGRETHYGHRYDVWVLVAHPSFGHYIGRRFAQLTGDAA